MTVRLVSPVCVCPLPTSLDALSRTAQMINDSRDIGVKTIAKLGEQTEQMERMNNDLSDIQSTLQRSQVIIKRMARKVVFLNMSRLCSFKPERTLL